MFANVSMFFFFESTFVNARKLNAPFGRSVWLFGRDSGDRFQLNREQIMTISVLIH